MKLGMLCMPYARELGMQQLCALRAGHATLHQTTLSFAFASEQHDAHGGTRLVSRLKCFMVEMFHG